MITVYGVINRNNEHIDVSKSLHGAKCYASRNRYNKISRRLGYNVVQIWEKVKGKWIEQL